jgi:hypothetical protein
VVFSLDGQILASSQRTHSICLWELKTGKQIQQIMTPDSVIRSLVFSPNGRWLAGGAQDGTVWIWDIFSGRALHTLEAHLDSVSSLAFSSDGTNLATGGEDKYVRCWETLTGEPCWLRKLGGKINGLAFSRDGRHLFSAFAGDNAIHLLSVPTSKDLKQLHGHQGGCTCVAVSGDGCLLATGSQDTTVLVWSLRDLVPKETLAPTPLSVKAMNQFWSLLASTRGHEAHVAVWFLSEGRQEVVSFLKSKLKPAAPINPKRVVQLIKELDNPKFSIRQSATRELRDLGPLAEKAVREALNHMPSAELRARLERLLQKLDDVPPPKTLRQARAVMVLEHIGTPEAINLLKSLAGGPSEARLTREAKASFDRLEKTKKQKEKRRSK